MCGCSELPKASLHAFTTRVASPTGPVPCPEPSEEATMAAMHTR